MRDPTLLRSPRSRRWLRAGLFIAFAWLFLWLIGWLAGPALVRQQLEQQGSALLGRPVTVQQVELSPWSLSLRLGGLRIAGPGASAPPLLAVDELFLDLELSSLWHGGPVIDALQIVGPRVHLTHLGEGRYDIDDLLERWRQPKEEAAAETRFAVFNIRVSGGGVTLLDAPRQLTHEVRDLRLEVPFLSNLPSRREVVTQPHLAFEVQGMRFDSRIESTPFAPDRETEARLNVQGLDIAPYLAYWPAGLPLRPLSGVVDADVSIHFAWHDRPEVTVRGQTQLSRVALQETRTTASSAEPAVAWDTLSLDIGELQPFNRRLVLKAVHLVGPRVGLERDAQGLLNVQRWAGAPGASSTPAQPAAPAWTVDVQRLALESGQLAWRDRATRPAAELAVTEAQLQVEGFQWPKGAPAQVTGSLQVADGRVEWRGKAGVDGGDIAMAINGVALRHARPYWAGRWPVDADGRGHVQGSVAWQRQGDTPMALTAVIDEARVADWRVGNPRRPDLQGATIVLRQGQLDLTGRRVRIGQLALERPDVLLSRSTDGAWMFERWLHPAPPAAPPQATAEAPPLTLTVDRVQVERARVRLRDERAGVNLDVDQVQTALDGLQWPANRPAAIQTQIRARVAIPGQDAGQIGYRGSLALPDASGQGFATRGELTAQRLPLHALEPYLNPQLNFDLLHADASFRGPITIRQGGAGPSVTVRGQASIDDLRAVTRDPAEPLLDWQTLQLRGLEVDVEAGALRRLVVQETALSDYFARIVIDEQGRINLQGLLQAPSAAAAPPSAPVAATAGTALPTAPETTAQPAKIAFGPIALVNGRVRFSDRFIQPNYNANLSELTGALSAFDNGVGRPDIPPPMAQVNLRGRVEGSASLEVNGQINPLTKPLTLDLRAEVRELELPPLTPYSSKYAGYGIERGKLSMNVSYRIDPDGRLQANNQIILNQLRFGDRIEGSEAPNLPVKLAVALLADRNGIIDINLPISGSINDPEFRLGPIIVRLIVNLIGKAITAPFALLSSAFAEADETQAVAFPPGQSTLDGPAREQLDRIARALADRPALRLTIVGHANLAEERDAWQRAVLRQRVAAEKRRRLLREGAAPDTAVTVSDDEYPALLREVYRRTDIAKPRNLIGLPKDLPPTEMERLLLATIPVGDAQMRELAVARALQVKNHLAAQQVSAEQLFLGSEQIALQPGTGTAPPPPRVNLTLSTR